MIELVVFDVAGTTVYDGGAVRAALRRTAAEFGVDATSEEIDRVMGLAKPVALRALLGAEATHRRVSDAHQAFTRYMLEHYLHAPSVRPVDGAEETLLALRETGVRTALDTGFDRRVLDAVMLRLGWTDVVDATIASDEVPEGRPAPFMIRRLMEETGVTDPRRVAKVGDTPADMREGLAAGCGFVAGVMTGTGTSEELTAAGATHVLPSVAFLPRLWNAAA